MEQQEIEAIARHPLVFAIVLSDPDQPDHAVRVAIADECSAADFMQRLHVANWQALGAASYARLNGSTHTQSAILMGTRDLRWLMQYLVLTNQIPNDPQLWSGDLFGMRLITFPAQVQQEAIG